VKKKGTLDSFALIPQTNLIFNTDLLLGIEHRKPLTAIYHEKYPVYLFMFLSLWKAPKKFKCQKESEIMKSQKENKVAKRVRNKAHTKTRCSIIQSLNGQWIFSLLSLFFQCSYWVWKIVT